jgi:hydrogenase nickel incorporation protein HypA/HybF
MHEYTLMQSVIESIQEVLKQEAVTAPVAEVVLKVGLLEVHSEPAARQAFQVLAKNTPLEGAQLTLEIIPATLTCQVCGHSEPYLVDHIHGHDLPAVDCPECRALATLSGGQGVESIQLVLDDSQPPA